MNISNTNEMAEAILRMQHAMPDGVVRDADTVLQDIYDAMEDEVTGTGFELIQLYLTAHDKVGFCRLFEAMTGTKWTSFLNESLRVMTQCTQPPEEPKVGQWMDVQEEELYVPDKHFTICRTSQTCSACGARTSFVGQKPYINDFFCPHCGKQMNPGWVFKHAPVYDDPTNIHGFMHERSCETAGNPTIAEVPCKPKNLHELQSTTGFHQPGDLV